MNRAELFTSVTRDLNRRDKTDFLPEWLISAEFRINQSLRVEEMVKHVTLPLTEMRFPVPPDFLKEKTIKITSGGASIGRFVYVPADQLDAGLAPPRVPGGPRFYTMRGRFIEIEPYGLNATYVVDMWYYAELSKLLADEDTNFLSTKAPHIYIMAIKHFGYRNMQEFERADAEMMQCLSEMELMNQKAMETLAGSGPLIMRPPKRLGGRFS